MNSNDNTKNVILQDELFEYLCYDKLYSHTRSELDYFESKIVYDNIAINNKRDITFKQSELIEYITNNKYLINILNKNKSALDTPTINAIYNKLLSCKDGVHLIIEKLNKKVLSIQACSNITQVIIEQYEDLFHLWMISAPSNKLTKMKLNKKYQDIVDSYLVMSKL